MVFIHHTTEVFGSCEERSPRSEAFVVLSQINISYTLFTMAKDFCYSVMKGHVNLSSQLPEASVISCIKTMAFLDQLQIPLLYYEESSKFQLNCY